MGVFSQYCVDKGAGSCYLVCEQRNKGGDIMISLNGQIESDYEHVQVITCKNSSTHHGAHTMLRKRAGEFCIHSYVIVELRNGRHKGRFVPVILSCKDNADSTTDDMRVSGLQRKIWAVRAGFRTL